jgi:hypothetical protein
MATPEIVIKSIRAATGETRWLNGDCYKLFEILQLIWPEAEPYYAPVEGHIYTEIDEVLYDIRGEVRRNPSPLMHLDDEPRIAKEALYWSYE